MRFDQTGFDIRCEWGAAGVAELADTSDAMIIVDVLSFSTCVTIAIERGTIIFPYRWRDGSASEYARGLGALVASSRREAGDGYSLSPASLMRIAAGTRLVLPSPNGATLSLAVGRAPTLAGCLRNAAAVARAAQQIGPRISVIPAGERWADGSLRPAIEDLIGAGAIVHRLTGARSPEAAIAEQAFVTAQPHLRSLIAEAGSGRELIAGGFASDVELATGLDASDAVGVLRDGAYVRWSDTHGS